MKEVFVVGRYLNKTDFGPVWEICGVFDEKQKAINSCTTPQHFVGPLILNQLLPEELVEWDGLLYPNVTE